MIKEEERVHKLVRDMELVRELAISNNWSNTDLISACINTVFSMLDKAGTSKESLLRLLDSYMAISKEIGQESKIFEDGITHDP